MAAAPSIAQAHPATNGEGVSSSAAATAPLFTFEQFQRLLSLIDTSSLTEKLAGKTLSNAWILDSGASQHMTGNLHLLHNISEVAPSTVGLPDGVQISAVKQGSAHLSTDFIIKDVLYVPNLKVNLISIGQLLLDIQCLVTFTGSLCVIQDHTTRTPIGVGELRNKVYCYKPVTRAAIFNATTADMTVLWHQPTSRSSKETHCVKSCDICFRAKQTRIPFPVSNNAAFTKL